MNKTVLLHQVSLAWMNLVLVIPSIYIGLALPLILREQGWSGTEIGLFQLAGLPVVFKWFMAIPVDKGPFFSGRYRTWAVGLVSLLIVICLFLGVNHSLLNSPKMLFMWVLAVSVVACWADIPINALAIRCLPTEERMRAGSWRSASTFLGAVLGGGFFLVVQQKYGWIAPFVLMIILLFSCLPVLILVKFHREKTKPVFSFETVGDKSCDSVPESLSSSWLNGFYQQDNAYFWTLILLIFFPLIGTAWFYAKPMLLDYGMTGLTVAWLAGVGGGLIGAVASVLGSFVSRQTTPHKMLIFSAVIAVVALSLLFVLLALKMPVEWISVGVIGVAIAAGFVSASAFGVMMFYSRPQARALDYGYQSSLFALGRIAMFAASGVLLDYAGYLGLMAFLSVGMVIVTVLMSAVFQLFDSSDISLIRDSNSQNISF